MGSPSAQLHLFINLIDFRFKILFSSWSGFPAIALYHIEAQVVVIHSTILKHSNATCFLLTIHETGFRRTSFHNFGIPWKKPVEWCKIIQRYFEIYDDERRSGLWQLKYCIVRNFLKNHIINSKECTGRICNYITRWRW